MGEGNCYRAFSNSVFKLQLSLAATRTRYLSNIISLQQQFTVSHKGFLPKVTYPDGEKQRDTS